VTFKCQDLVVNTLGLKAELTALLACTSPTISGETCAGPSCGYPSLGAWGDHNSKEQGLALLRQQLRQTRLESELPN
jgi:hypothetical protein